MKFQHKLVVTILGVIFAVLVIMLVITWTQGDKSNKDNGQHGGGQGISRPTAVHTLP